VVQHSPAKLLGLEVRGQFIHGDGIEQAHGLFPLRPSARGGRRQAVDRHQLGRLG
jgi:hypothetical protein